MEPYKQVKTSMGKSKNLRLQDAQCIFQLVSECRDLGDDAGAWRKHLIEGASKLVKAGLGMTAEWHWSIQDGSPFNKTIYQSRMKGRRAFDAIRGGHGPEVVNGPEWGWHNGFEQSVWPKALQEFANGTCVIPMYEPYSAKRYAMPMNSGLSLTRSDLLTDGEWYRSPFYTKYAQSIGGDHVMYSHYSSGAREVREHELTLIREAGAPDFSLRDRTIIFELNTVLASLIGGPLATFVDPSPSHLSPRRRQILAALLEGDSDKQIAKRLGISVHTVNQQVKAIFQYFSVSSRPELLARWIRRGWGRRLGWVEGL